MNRTFRAVLAILFVGVITFSGIHIFQTLGRTLRIDVTEQKLYSLSEGTRNILAKLSQPLTLDLYYARTAAMKGPDTIQFFNEYFFFVKALLEEYASAANGMVKLNVIDPRPYSEEEASALQGGLQRLAITDEESFFFGLVVRTQFGVQKVIPLFSPDRQRFVEYDVSYLIDTAITREKKRIGILSSLSITGDDATGYMAQMMRMQGQQPRPAWVIVQQLRQQYEVSNIGADVEEIKGIDLLLVVHPKALPEKTLFAIDQFVLKGGRLIVCVDPHCISDQPPAQSQMQARIGYDTSSDLNRLLRTWGLEMVEETYAGDRSLAVVATIGQNQRPQKIIGFLELKREHVNQENPISASLNQVRLLFPGVLREVDVASEDAGEGSATGQIERTALLFTSDRGNSWKPQSQIEMRMTVDPARLMEQFTDGREPVHMGYLVTGRFKSSFPEGIEIEDESPDVPRSDSVDGSDKQDEPKMRKITGLTEAREDCAVVVFSDVDFISDAVAYQRSFFGIAVVGDNSALLMNTIEDLSGSSDLLSIRSRGNFKRPFKVIEAIEAEAEAEIAEKVKAINARIMGFQVELQEIVSKAKAGEEEIIGSTIIKKKKELELSIRVAQKDLRDVRLEKRKRREKVEAQLQKANMIVTPAAIFLVAMGLWVRRGVKRQRHINQLKNIE
ncbi:MAG: GldG family protein [Planctomycetes bacterium]|nr:GldG family protein [Planctomycetota bacterium]